MISYYTANVFLSSLTVMILGILVFENARFEQKTKNRFYLAICCIIIAIVSEWLGMILNSTPSWTTGIHGFVKCMDYVFTPLAVFSFAYVILDESEHHRHLWMMIILCINALFQITSIFTGWTFHIDDGNIYRHGPLYPVYMIVYILSVIDAMIAFRSYSRNFRRQNILSLFSILLLIFAGIIFQEFTSPDIRTSCLAFAFGSVLLFIHYNEFLQQRNDDTLEMTQNLVETDPLTGMSSRYAYINTLDDYHNMSSLPNNLIVFSIDINGLKTVNDTKGHAIGDELICDAAECLSIVLSPFGKCFRTGGDEFVAIIETDPKTVSDLYAQLHKQTEHYPYLSFSVGYAISAEHPDETIDDLIRISDQKMYREKWKHYQTTTR